MSGVVIVGGGQAGLEAAAALRTRGYEGAVTLICEEPHAPYQRPPLSKDFLTGKQDAGSLPLRALTFYEKHRIDLILGDKVTGIDRGCKRVAWSMWSVHTNHRERKSCGTSSCCPNC